MSTKRAQIPNEHVPIWPQPAGVYSDGMFFNPIKFLQLVRETWNSQAEVEMLGSEIDVSHAAFVEFFKL